MNRTLDAIHGLKAAWRLLCLDEDGLKDFNRTADGFWNSFTAIYIVAPMYLYSVDVSARLSQPPQEATSWLTSLAALCLMWVLWPWAMIAISHMMGREKNYVRYIVSYNWSSVYVIAALVPVLMLGQLGIAGAGIIALGSLSVLVWSMMYRWYVAHKALDVPAMTAGLLVAFDLVLTIAVTSVI